MDSIIKNNFKSTLKSNFSSVSKNNTIKTDLHKLFKSKVIFNLSNLIDVYGIRFKSGSFSLTKFEDKNGETGYILNFRMLNYSIINNSYMPNIKINKNNIFISLNKITKLDNNLKIINENKIIIPPALKDLSKGLNNTNKTIFGIEDMRIFNFNGKMMIIGTSQDFNGKSNIISGEYDYETNNLSNISFIENTFNKQNVEKNWVYFINDNNELNIIYKWFPLQICEIKNNKLYLLKNITLPNYFLNARGSTCCVKHDNKNWFIVHFNEEGNYYHFFAVFDLKMNLIKYSEKFKFEGHIIEFCIGFEFKDDNMIIGYSLNDTISKMAIYRPSRLNDLKWYSI